MDTERPRQPAGRLLKSGLQVARVEQAAPQDAAREAGAAMTPTPLATTLGGTLERRDDGWVWRDGTPEPRVHDLPLSHFAPNFRCMTDGRGRCCVEIPDGWEDRFTWDHAPDTAAAIRAVIREAGARAPVFAERVAAVLDDHRVSQPGHRVPVEIWDAHMSEPAGAGWESVHETDILTRAAALGYQRPPSAPR